MSPLVSAMRKGSFVVAIEIVVVSLGQVGWTRHAKRLAKCGKAEQSLTRTHRMLLPNSRRKQVTNDFGLGLVLLFGEHMNVLIQLSRQVYLFSDHMWHSVYCIS